jgi:hypothetical protein
MKGQNMIALIFYIVVRVLIVWGAIAIFLEISNGLGQSFREFRRRRRELIK